MAAYTIGLAEAKNNFSKITAEVNRTGRPVTVLKNNKPWVVIQPAAGAGEAGSNVAVDLLDSIAYAVVPLDAEADEAAEG